jgi:hypothetical protein
METSYDLGGSLDLAEGVRRSQSNPVNDFKGGGDTRGLVDS